MRKLLVTVVLMFCAPAAFCENPWISLGKPTTRDLIRVFFVDSTRGWVTGDSGVIMKTTNAGESWDTQRSEIESPIHGIFMLDARKGWALALDDRPDSAGTLLLKTTNGGDSWSRLRIPDEFYYAVHFLDSSNGLLGGTGGKILRSTDGGLTWTPAIVDSAIYAYFNVRHFQFYSHDYGFAMGGQLDITGVVWRTFDGGRKWTAFQASNEPVHGLHFIDSLNMITVSGDFDAGSSMSRSTDGGQTWEYIYLGVWGEARTLTFRTPSEGWCPLGFAGTYMLTTDTGTTWSVFNAPDGYGIFDAMFVDSTHGYMVGASGTLLSYKPSTVGVNAPGQVFPVTSKLDQNYPNPFNPVTVIPYDLSQECNVVITVYDVAGRKVRTILRSRQESGHHQVTFDATDLGSGVYYYELATENAGVRSAQIRKMVLLR